MARNVYVTTALTGGSLALDGIDGAALAKGDLGIFAQKDSTTLAGTHGVYYAIYYASTNAAAESSAPAIVVPDANPGSFNWKLASPLWPVFHTTGKTATIPNYGVTVIRTTAPTVHVLRRPRRGSYKKLIFATTQIVKVRMSTSVATAFVKLGRCGLVAGSSIFVLVAPTSRSLLRLPVSIELIGRSTSRWELAGYDNPSTGTSKSLIGYATTT